VLFCYLRSEMQHLFCACSLSEESGLFEAGEVLNADDKLEIISECWVEPVNGTVANCTSELSHLNDSVYTRIPDLVRHWFCLIFLLCICYPCISIRYSRVSVG